ncbi:MAG: hypothetical protein R3B54_11825 [Bdellovibrionota bacterium]
MKRIFGFVGILCLAVGAFGCPDGDDFVREGFAAIYEQLHAEVLNALKAKDPSIVGVTPVYSEAGDTVVKVELDYSDHKTVLPQTYFMGFADKHYLSYDTQVDVDFRGVGLSKLMLAFFLLTRPELTHTEAQLLETSEVAFIVAFLEGKTGTALRDRVKTVDPEGLEIEDLRKKLAHQLSRFEETEEVIAARNRILSAALNNPIGRAQIAVSMGKLKRVIVALPKSEKRYLDIRLEFDRGVLSEGDHDKVEVLIAELGENESIRGPRVPYLRLLPSGLYQQDIDQLLR